MADSMDCSVFTYIQVQLSP